MLKSDFPKVPRQAEAETDGVINTQNYEFKQCLNTGNLDALKTLRINRTRLENLATRALRKTRRSDTYQIVEI